MIYELPAGNSRLDEMRQRMAECPELSLLKTYLLNGFPPTSPSWEIAAYRNVVDDIIEADGLLLKDGKIIVYDRSYIVGACATCCASRRQQPPEPLMPRPVPSFPWRKYELISSRMTSGTICWSWIISRSFRLSCCCRINQHRR